MDEKIKSTILSLMPNELEYALKLLKNKHNRRLDYAEIEKITEKTTMQLTNGTLIGMIPRLILKR